MCVFAAVMPGIGEQLPLLPFSILKTRGHRGQVTSFKICITEIFFRSALQLTYIISITIFSFLFYLYMYSPDSQESDGGINRLHRTSNYPDLLPEMPRYFCLLEI